MAKLVQKSGYIKSEKAGGYMKYIATREGVEKLTGNGPVTKGQRELIQKLLHDFPDAVELFEYEDYRGAYPWYRISFHHHGAGCKSP